MVVPHPMHINAQDLERWGYTMGCRECTLMRNKRKSHGIRHDPECRARLEAKAREDHDPRVVRADARRIAYEDEILQRTQPRREEGGVQEEIPAAAVPPTTTNSAISATATPGIPPVPAPAEVYPQPSLVPNLPHHGDDGTYGQMDINSVNVCEVKIQNSQEEDKQ